MSLNTCMVLSSYFQNFYQLVNEDKKLINFLENDSELTMCLDDFDFSNIFGEAMVAKLFDFRFSGGLVDKLCNFNEALRMLMDDKNIEFVDPFRVEETEEFYKNCTNYQKKVYNFLLHLSLAMIHSLKN